VPTKFQRDRDEASSGRRLLGLSGIGVVLLAALVFVWWPGCRQYPEVSSKEALQLVKLLYAACNTRDADRLAKVEARLEHVEAAGKLTPQEGQAFRAIIELARAGDWEQATRSSFKFAQDQIR
jgi:hypothetical protein